jgi:glycosyltransferase involved in cell wall biosynthesis
MLLSIISPVYNSSLTLPELVRQINIICDECGINYELLLVDDGSQDNSWGVLTELKRVYSSIKAYKLSKNFGQHAAITAGIQKSLGDLVLIIDCDLQDDPKYIPLLIEKNREGFDIVCTLKRNKKYSFWRSSTSIIFHSVFNLLSDTKLEKGLGSMVLINRKIANEFLKINDVHRHYAILFAWLGFKRGFIEIDHKERFAGNSSYTLRKLINHAIDGAISNSSKLLNFAVFCGILFLNISIISAIGIIILRFFFDFQIGWASIVLGILFTAGMALLIQGLSAIYIGKIFEQSKARPIFIVDKEIE